MYDAWDTVLGYIDYERSYNIICILRVPIEMDFVIGTIIGMIISGLAMLQSILEKKQPEN